MHSKGLRLFLSVGLVLAIMAAFVGMATAQDTDWSTLIEQAKSAVVWIVVETSEGTSAGSGAIISPDGYILTAGHVVKGASKITVVVEESKQYGASIVSADYDMDVALLKIPAGSLTWLALGDSDEVRYDEEIQVLGYPLPQQGVGYIAVAGKVQGFRTYKDVTLIQHDAPTEGGHSGGPVINAQGEIIAVHTSWIGGEHSKYTIGVAINSAKQIIPYGVLPNGPSPVRPAVTPPAHAGPIRVPEDYSTIQAAVRAAGEGGEIRVSSGTYKGDITITKPVSIEGETGVVIHGSVRVSSVNSLYLANLTIQGGMEVRDSSGVTSKSLVITGNTGDGLLVSASSISISNTTIQNNQGAGLVAVFQSRLMIANCSIEKNEKAGISIALGSQASIVGNRVTANGSDGIAVFGATADLRNNILRQNEGYGLNSDASATLTGAGNQAGADVPEEFSTIEAAINVLNKMGGKSTAVPAGIISTAIMIGPGTYKETVNAVRSVDLIGAGSTRSIVRGIEVSGTAQVLIQDLAIRGDGISLEDASQATIENCAISENNWDGITLCDAAQAGVENCTVSRNGRNGISIRDSAQAELRGNLIQWNSDYGIYAEGGTVLSGRDNTISGGKVPSEFPTIQAAVNGGNGDGAISSNVPVGLVKHGTIAITPGTYEEAVDIVCSVDLIGSGSERTTVRGIYVSGAIQVLIQDLAIVQHARLSYGGVYIEHSARVTIENCRISTSNISGINIGGIALWDTAQAIVQHCTISENYNAGIFLEGAAQAIIVNNDINNNAGAGITTQDFHGKVTGHDNKMWNNGVDLEGNVPGALRTPLESPTEPEIRFPDPRYQSLQSAVDALVSGGRLVLDSGVYEAGVTISKQVQITAADGVQVTLQARNETAPVFSLVHDADLRLIGVTVTKGKSGLLLAGDAKATIKACTISGNGSACISCRGTSLATIEDCSIYENHDGIYLSDAAQATIQNCTISRNAWEGIAIVDSSQATIENCTISENSDCGILLRNTAKATVEVCTISGNSSAGIQLLDAAQATIMNNDINNNAGAGISGSDKFFYSLGFSGKVTGHDNKMWNNGVDLKGNVPGSLRIPLKQPTEQEIQFPDPRYSSLQSAVDALMAGGRLILKAGEYEAGVTIAKQIEIMSAEGVQVTLRGRNHDAPVLSLVRSADLTMTRIMVTKGECALVLGGDAVATISTSTIFKSTEGIHLLDTAQATIEDCSILENGIGIVLTQGSQAIVKDSTIWENGETGIFLAGSSQAAIETCSITNNGKYTFWPLKGCGIECSKFTGEVTGKNNVVPGPDDPNGNENALCPSYPGAPWPEGFLKQ